MRKLKNKGMLPKLNKNDKLILNEMTIIERFSKHPQGM